MTLAELHDACVRLTGDPWCPYPSGLLLAWGDGASDDDLEAVIRERRTLLFPDFLAREPQLSRFGGDE